MPIFKREPDLPFSQQAQNAGRQAFASSASQRTQAPTPAAPQRSQAPASPPPVASPMPAAPIVETSPSTAPVVARAAREAAVLDRKTEITGNLHSQGNVLIEGGFHGEIQAKETVWVENGAQAQGQLRANDAVISGKFDGQITCENRLQIAETATVSGEINTPVLVIEGGATVNCRFSMKRTGR